MKCIPVYFCLLGLFVGITVAFALNQIILSRIDAGYPNLILAVLCVIFGIVGAYIGFKFREHIIIIGTSIVGSYLIIKALAL